jgi:hypothetical protein
MAIRCKNCNDNGMYKMDNPEIISKPVSMQCWVCSGTTLDGMTSVQIKWYVSRFAMMEKFESEVYKLGELADKTGYAQLKFDINKVASRLDIKMLTPVTPMPNPNVRSFSMPKAILLSEIQEMKRRLAAIPVAMKIRKG